MIESSVLFLECDACMCFRLLFCTTCCQRPQWRHVPQYYGATRKNLASAGTVKDLLFTWPYFHVDLNGIYWRDYIFAIKHILLYNPFIKKLSTRALFLRLDALTNFREKKVLANKKCFTVILTVICILLSVIGHKITKCCQSLEHVVQTNSWNCGSLFLQVTHSSSHHCMILKVFWCELFTALKHAHGYFPRWKISRKCCQDISCRGNFQDTTPFSFVKAFWFYFRVGVIFAKKQKREKLPPRQNFHVYSILKWITFIKYFRRNCAS